MHTAEIIDEDSEIALECFQHFAQYKGTLTINGVVFSKSFIRHRTRNFDSHIRKGIVVRVVTELRRFLLIDLYTAICLDYPRFFQKFLRDTELVYFSRDCGVPTSFWHPEPGICRDVQLCELVSDAFRHNTVSSEFSSLSLFHLLV